MSPFELLTDGRTKQRVPFTVSEKEMMATSDCNESHNFSPFLTFIFSTKKKKKGKKPHMPQLYFSVLCLFLVYVNFVPMSAAYIEFMHTWVGVSQLWKNTFSKENAVVFFSRYRRGPVFLYLFSKKLEVAEVCCVLVHPFCDCFQMSMYFRKQWFCKQCIRLGNFCR